MSTFFLLFVIVRVDAPHVVTSNNANYVQRTKSFVRLTTNRRSNVYET